MDEKEKEFAYRMYAQRANELKQQVQSIQHLIAECDSTEKAIDGLGDNALFSLGSGVLVRASPEKGKVLAECGRGVLVEKTRAEATEFLTEKRKRLEEALIRVQDALDETVKGAQSLQ